MTAVLPHFKSKRQMPSHVLSYRHLLVIVALLYFSGPMYTSSTAVVESLHPTTLPVHTAVLSSPLSLVWCLSSWLISL